MAARVAPAQVVIAAALAGVVVAALTRNVVGVVVVLCLAALAAAGVAFLRRYRGTAVAGPDYQFEGRPIRGDALTTLRDIDARMAEAAEVTRGVDTGVDWPRVRAAADVLLWEAAGHAATVCELNDEIADLRAPDGTPPEGTPAAAQLAAAQARRQGHRDAMQRIHDEATEVAQLARQLVSAERTTMRSLPGADDGLPSTAQLAAETALVDAKERLRSLANAWAALDRDPPTPG